MLKLIPLDLGQGGFFDFLGAWLSKGTGCTFVVDPGPATTIPGLVARLRAEGITHLDFVLLTHIHLDHGGGAAEILEAFPEARLFTHPKAVPHLMDPGALWEGSCKTLGEIARMYGKPRPVPQECFAAEGDLVRQGIRVLLTPGHAVHHVSYVFEETFFAGEAMGVHLETQDHRHYLRPATPPRFFLESAMGSLERILALPREPAHTAFGHYGCAEGTFRWANTARDQLYLWVEIAKTLPPSPPEGLVPAFLSALEARDSSYVAAGVWEGLPSEVRERETYFIGNSLKGILGYIESSA